MTWLIIGAGVSGLGAAKLLRSRNLDVRISEGSLLPKDKREKFKMIGADLFDGGHKSEHLDGISQIVVSPGIPVSHPLLVEAKHRNIPVMTEIDLAIREYTGFLFAVTGTNGKSTTCAMIHHLMRKLGTDTALGGNFGEPPTQMLAEGKLAPYLILELSSYQLEQSASVKPKVAIFTSFSHDHLSRHGSLEGYLKAKWRVFEHMPKDSLAIIPQNILDEAKVSGLSIDEKNTRIISDTDYLHSLAPKSIAEPHNRLNAGFAISAVAHALGSDVGDIAPLLNDFVGLRHRCEVIGRIKNLPVINDSKSTNVESTLVALQGQIQPVILMMGGQGKGESYLPILQLKENIAAIVVFGASGPEIARDLKGSVRVHEFPNLKIALDQIAGIIKHKVAPILFSPGCASFDEFSNYEHRGEVFRTSMRPLLDP